MHLADNLWPCPQSISTVSKYFIAPQTVALRGDQLTSRMTSDLEKIGRLAISENVPFVIDVASDAACDKCDEYSLSVSRSGIRIAASSPQSASYGMQTLLQIIALGRASGKWPEVEISDWATYSKRCFMLDMGRSIFSLPYLKQIVRILARLKMNQLHLHLYDDELCGLRFDALPFGSENPYAIAIDELAELVGYASKYHVEIVPELEGWGHVGSLVYHRPELHGGPGMFHGSSFLMCNATFELMYELIGQVINVMPAEATIHVGLDEAKLFVDPELGTTFTPTDIVQRYYDIVQELAAKTGRKATMRLWADHAGRPVPSEIQHNVIIEPWQYWFKNQAEIDRLIDKYSAANMRWMAGAGQSMAQSLGAWQATRYWAQQARNAKNLDGINVTFWGWNDLDHKMITLMTGAYYSWNPCATSNFANIQDVEQFDQAVSPVMRWWQSIFKDARPDILAEIRGDTVFNGFYVWSKRNGLPVAPTVLPANTRKGHDFVNEMSQYSNNESSVSA